MLLMHITSSLKETFPVRATEWALAAILFLWGVVLVVNPTLFITGESYKNLNDLMRQDTWASLCILVGGLRLMMLAINGTWRRSPHMRIVGAFVSCFFWFQISIGIAQSGVFGTGLAVYPVLFFLDTYNVFRATRDAGAVDYIHSRKTDNGIQR